MLRPAIISLLLLTRAGSSAFHFRPPDFQQFRSPSRLHSSLASQLPSPLAMEPLVFTGTRPGYDITDTFTAPFQAPPLKDEEAAAQYPMRMKAFLHAFRPDLFPTITSSRKKVRRKEVLLNGKEANSDDAVQAGDTVALQSRKEPGLFPQGSGPSFTVEVVYEDDHMAVIVKPPGIPVHGGTASEDNGPLTRRSLRAALPYALQPSRATEDVLRRPIHVHRLDAPTGGLLVVAKTRTASADLARQFAERRVTKRYRAVVHGELAGRGTVDVPLDGKEACTFYAVDDRPGMAARSLKSGVITTVDLWPKTGRNHQLRRHLASLGHPILGDAQHTVSGVELLEGEGLFLWALGLTLAHPATGQELSLCLPEPPKFELWRRREQARWEKFNDGGDGGGGEGGEEADGAAAARIAATVDGITSSSSDVSFGPGAAATSAAEPALALKTPGAVLNAVPDLPGLKVIDKEGFRYYQYDWDEAERKEGGEKEIAANA